MEWFQCDICQILLEDPHKFLMHKNTHLDKSDGRSKVNLFETGVGFVPLTQLNSSAVLYTPQINLSKLELCFGSSQRTIHDPIVILAKLKIKQQSQSAGNEAPVHKPHCLFCGVPGCHGNHDIMENKPGLGIQFKCFKCSSTFPKSRDLLSHLAQCSRSGEIPDKPPEIQQSGESDPIPIPHENVSVKIEPCEIIDEVPQEIPQTVENDHPSTLLQTAVVQPMDPPPPMPSPAPICPPVLQDMATLQILPEENHPQYTQFFGCSPCALNFFTMESLQHHLDTVCLPTALRRRQQQQMTNSNIADSILSTQLSLTMIQSAAPPWQTNNQHHQWNLPQLGGFGSQVTHNFMNSSWNQNATHQLPPPQGNNVNVGSALFPSGGVGPLEGYCNQSLPIAPMESRPTFSLVDGGPWRYNLQNEAMTGVANFNNSTHQNCVLEEIPNNGPTSSTQRQEGGESGWQNGNVRIGFVEFGRHDVTAKKSECPSCGKCYATKYYLKQHMTSCKSKLPKLKPKPCKPPPTQELKHYRCSQCPSSFDSSRKLQNHFHKHHFQRIFECPICKQTYTDRNLLDLHLNNHQNLTDSSLPGNSRLNY